MLPRGSHSPAGLALASAFIEKRSRDGTDADDRDVAFAVASAWEGDSVEAMTAVGPLAGALLIARGRDCSPLPAAV